MIRNMCSLLFFWVSVYPTLPAEGLCSTPHSDKRGIEGVVGFVVPFLAIFFVFIPFVCYSAIFNVLCPSQGLMTAQRPVHKDPILSPTVIGPIVNLCTHALTGKL